MSAPDDLWHRSSPLAHLCFLVSEALNPRPRPEARPMPPRPSVARTGWLDRLDQWAWRSRQRQHEAYLAEAANLAELETRLRDLERTVGARYY
jgi:hypothetical protein